MADRLCLALVVLAVALAVIGVASLREARRERRIAGILFRLARACLADTEALSVKAAEVVDERGEP